MQKDERSYTFFLSHKTKSKISFRRVNISKKLFYSGIIILILTFGLITLGLTQFTGGISLAKIESNAPSKADLAAPPTKTNSDNSKIGYTPINYDRPASSKNMTADSGGPAVPFRLTVFESEAEENAMEKQLHLIETTSNPSFLPTLWSHLGKINNEFGFRRDPFGERSYEFHAGMDIGGEKGEPVAASANGIVTNAEWTGGYGNMIEIDHGNGLTTRYGHLSQIGVQLGDAVQRGQIIGLIGSTGRSTGPHLHFELRLNDKSINPRRFLPPVPSEISPMKAQ